MKHLLLRGRVITPTAEFAQGALLIVGDRIAAVGPADQVVVPPTASVLDLGDQIIAPGFIDLQLNGAYGHDFTAQPASVRAVATRLPATGVTAFLPTLITSPHQAYPALLTELAAASAGAAGARILGAHLEGPFLSPTKPGAHNPQLIRPPASDDLDWITATGLVRLLTLAPEVPGALDLIPHLRERGIVVAAGHSAATYAQAQAGFAAGITYGTHLFDAMSPFHHREPGLAGALLTNPVLPVGVIADGIHLHPAAVELIHRAKGPTTITLVTDAMAAAGMPPGHYRLADRDVTVTATAARLADGTLAGSLLSLDVALRNYLAFTGCSLAEALQTITLTPATLLGLTADYGRLVPGALADLVVLTPAHQVAMTLIGGQIVYSAR